MNELVLAFDVGLKRTGVACGQQFNQSANPAGQITVVRGRHDWAAVDSIVEEWEPDLILVGDPQTNDPHLNKAINRLKSHIQKYHKIKIIDVNERLSSNSANHEMANRGLSLARKTELRDQVAACLILESYFADNKSTAN